MSSHDFHPAVAAWFAARFDGPTRPQARGWPAIQTGTHTLIAAPTGSGKTLAAFLASLDQLFKEGLAHRLGEETKILYVSPLKALSNDIHQNLAEPLDGIKQTLAGMGYEVPEVRAAVRTGDTTPSQRQSIAKHPPHILVTTPESFYLLLTSVSGRNTLRTVETLIVDEIHALANNRRGAHLALSMERLEHLVKGRLQRIGLSATQRPMELVARFLVGNRDSEPASSALQDCAIIDEGHVKQWDLALEVPSSPLEAVMANEVWSELYHRLVALIQEHQTTLIFVNTRRLAERVTYHLKHELGEDSVTSHHGSLSLRMRQNAEQRLKSGQLKALVATASLELGIDIGAVDLACQLGTPRSISTLLQRVGRSGHSHGGIPKGRIFPLTRDELIECAALMRAVKRGDLDRLSLPEKPLDILGQQIVAAAACEDWNEGDLYRLFKRAYVYRKLERDEFDQVVRMLAEGFGTRRGRRGTHIYHDAVNGRIKGRKGARLTALTSGGAIPDNADYQVVLEPEGTFIGTLNEDFAIESIPGDIFQLGNNSWRMLKVERGTVRVEDAHGLPPTIPFWFGEAPGRTDELSRAVSDLRAEVDPLLNDSTALRRLLTEAFGLDPAAAEQIEAYLTAVKKALGLIPTREHVVAERFFDEAGGMQLVIHAPLGSRLNRAWGLALRKRFCRSFNFELQAAANEDAIVLSLGPKHSFPLDDVFHFLNSKTVRAVLTQALLDAPMFQTRWRWNASRSLALPRQRGGKRVPPQLQRMEAEDLIALVFPDQLACQENLTGEREVPDHPLIHQTVEDCLHEAMDLDGLIAYLQDLESGRVKYTALDVPEPSPLSHEVLSAKPYAFLDDAPLEERRTQAVLLRRSLATENMTERDLLDQTAVETVRQQAWPTAENRDEVHEILWLLGGLSRAEADRQEPRTLWQAALAHLAEEGRAGLMTLEAAGRSFEAFIPAERLPLWRALHPELRVQPALIPPARQREETWEPEQACIELLRGRLEVCGPATAAQLAAWYGISESRADAALLALEAEGAILRGKFDAALEGRQWCDRGLLARIHRLTIDRLRAQIKPVTTQTYMRFLFQWQHVEPEHRARELEGLESVIGCLEGFEAAASSWETDLLSTRMAPYARNWLDQLCLSGRVAWGRPRPPAAARGRNGPLKTTPISLFFRENTELWCGADPQAMTLSTYATCVLEILQARGALFFEEIREASGLLHTQAEMGLGELVALGLATADSFAGLRALLLPSNKKPKPHRPMRAYRNQTPGIAFAGRWSLLGGTPSTEDVPETADKRLEYRARVLLRRYGIVFRRVLDREAQPPPWRELLRVYRRMEAVGEVRGGRFVDRFSGEQFALPEAVGLLRAKRNQPPAPGPICLNACDPLNLTGILIPGPGVVQTPGNRLLFQDGLPVAALEAGKIRNIREHDLTPDILALLKRKTTKTFVV